MIQQDFEINGVRFKAGKIDAFRQFHIVRRLAPVLKELLPALGRMASVDKDGASMTEAQKFEKFAELAAPVLEGLASLNDKDADFVLHSLLASVEMEQKEHRGVWSTLSTGSQLKFYDMELPVLLQCAGRALFFNLSGFFSLLPKAS